MDFDDLVYEVVAQWGRDLIECSDSMNRCRNLTDPLDIKTFVVCTSKTLYRPRTGWNKKILFELVQDQVRLICFSNLDKVIDMLTSITDEPLQVVNKVWTECEKLYPYWNEFFLKEYNKIVKGCS